MIKLSPKHPIRCTLSPLTSKKGGDCGITYPEDLDIGNSEVPDSLPTLYSRGIYVIDESEHVYTEHVWTNLHGENRRDASLVRVSSINLIQLMSILGHFCSLKYLIMDEYENSLGRPFG